VPGASHLTRRRRSRLHALGEPNETRRSIRLPSSASASDAPNSHRRSAGRGPTVTRGASHRPPPRSSRMAGSEGERRATDRRRRVRAGGALRSRRAPVRDGGVGARERDAPRERPDATARRPAAVRARRAGSSARAAGALAGRGVRQCPCGRGYGTPPRSTSGRLRTDRSRVDDDPGGGRFVHRMESSGTRSTRGAVGFVFVNHLDGQLPPPDP